MTVMVFAAIARGPAIDGCDARVRPDHAVDGAVFSVGLPAIDGCDARVRPDHRSFGCQAGGSRVHLGPFAALMLDQTRARNPATRGPGPAVF